MNKFQKVGLAMVFAAGMVFASGSLWRVGAPYGIAQFDWIKTCMSSPDFDEGDSTATCYRDMGGWWFGFVAGPSSGATKPKCDVKRNEAYTTGTNYVKAKIDGQWVSFNGPDYDNCEGPSFTNKENGSYIIDRGLEFELNIGAGVDASYEQAIAAIGINFSQPPQPGYAPPTNRDFTSKGGFCMTYELSGLDKPENFAMELGWDDDDASQEDDAHKIPYDAWWHNIPQGDGIQVKDFEWSKFEQDGWAKPAPWPLSKATSEMRSVKMRLKVPKAPYLPAGPVKFTLIQFGWKGECDTKACMRDDEECIGGGGGTPVISRGPVVSNVSFKQAGRAFSLASSVTKPVAVQVINLQGAIVYSQTMSENSVMNLSNLPTGIYMLRVPALGYTSKAILK